jgi:hypothetical protein
VTYEKAMRWLEAIGGAHEIVHEAGGKDVVIVSVSSATRGSVSRRMSLDASLVGPARDQAFRTAFALACGELKLALS